MFMTVLRQGITLVYHPPNKAKSLSVQVYAHNSTDLIISPNDKFRSWFSGTKRIPPIPLGDILFVVWGKQSHNFGSRHLDFVGSDICFSLVTKDHTLDFEAKSKDERDGLCDGFKFLLEDMVIRKKSVRSSHKVTLGGVEFDSIDATGQSLYH
jgi:hypothetical protein